MSRRGWPTATAVTAALLLAPGPGVAAMAGPRVAPALGVAAVAGPQVPALPDAGTDCVPASTTVQQGAEWGQARMAAPTVWPLTRGAGVRVAVLDTGVSSAPPALAGAVLAGVDVVRAGRADRDCRGRGTFLAGLIAGRPVTGTDFSGVAPQALIVPVRVTDTAGKVTAGSLAAGLRAAVAAGARVALVATATGPSAELREAVDFAVANDVVVVASIADTGKTGADEPAEPGYPAAYPPVLAVAGVSAGGEPGKGAASAGADLTAPGVAAVSVGPSGDGHYTADGSGVAAAYVAGVATLVRSYHPRLSAARVIRRLTATAVPLPAAGTGAGLVDGYDAVASLTAETPPAAGPAVPVRLPGLPASPAEPRRALLVSLLLLAGLALVVSAVVVARNRRRPVTGPD